MTQYNTVILQISSEPSIVLATILGSIGSLLCFLSVPTLFNVCDVNVCMFLRVREQATDVLHDGPLQVGQG